MPDENPSQPDNPKEGASPKPRTGARDPWLVHVARQVDGSARAVADATAEVAQRLFGKQASRAERARQEKEALELLDTLKDKLVSAKTEDDSRLADMGIWKTIDKLHALRHVARPPMTAKPVATPSAPTAPEPKGEPSVLEPEVEAKVEPPAKKRGSGDDD